MKTIIQSILIFTILSITWGCFDMRSDYEKSLDNTDECLEKKATDLENKSIDQALANYEFGEARAFLSCYEDACFNDYKTRSDCSGTRWTSKEEMLETNPHLKQLKKIVSAEVSYYLANNEINRGKFVASEAGLMDIYYEKIPTIIKKYANRGNVDAVLDLLIDWEFQVASYDLETTYLQNTDYNEERKKYNELLNTIIKASIANSNVTLANKTLSFYQPIIIKGKQLENYSPFDYIPKISNTPKENAKKKLKDAGIPVK